MAIKRQVSKKKLKAWIEANVFTDNGRNIYADDLLHAIDSGELDMVKDYRIHGEKEDNA